mgnify:CR=1 FL=1
MRILVVDDELDIREFVQYNLVKEGSEVTCATNGREALEQAVAFRPHLILLDMMMPEMDGIMATSRIREVSNVPIIFLTAKTLKEDVLEGFKLGADDYLTKPFSMEELTFRIEAILRRVHGKLDKRFDRTYQALYSYKLTFCFTTDAGSLEGLNGKSFHVQQVDFVQEYFPDARI